MPTRDIKESCRTSRTLAKISAGAERLFWRLTTYADDYGRMPADADVVRAACFPVMLDTVRQVQISGWLDELATVDLIRFYAGADGKRYAFFPTWAKHQRTRAKHSKYPAPTSAGTCQPMSADVAVVTEETEDTEVPPKTPFRDIGPRAEAPAWPTPEGLVELYNAKAPDECPAVETLSPKRQVNARKVLAIFPERAWWEQVFAQMHASRLLRGLKNGTGHEKWVADFDWLLAASKSGGTENCVLVHDGRYLDG